MPPRECAEVPAGKDAKDFALEDQVKRLGVRRADGDRKMKKEEFSSCVEAGLVLTRRTPAPADEARPAELHPQGRPLREGQVEG